jgi:hypothetical protein
MVAAEGRGYVAATATGPAPSSTGGCMNRNRTLALVGGFVLFAAGAAVPAIAADLADTGTYDGQTPSLNLLPSRFVVGQAIDATVAQDPENFCAQYWHHDIPMQLQWTASDSGSGIAANEVNIWKSHTDPVNIPLDPTARSLAFNGGNYEDDCGGGDTDDQYRVTVTDGAGGSSTSRAASENVGVWQEDGNNIGVFWSSRVTVSVSRSGTWQTSNCTCFDAGRTIYSTRAGASVTFTVTGANNFGLVMPKNTNRGKVAIALDGGTPVTVDTYASSSQNRIIVWQKQFTEQGVHTVVVTNKATSGRSRVDIEAVLAQGSLTP